MDSEELMSPVASSISGLVDCAEAQMDKDKLPRKNIES